MHKKRTENSINIIIILIALIISGTTFVGYLFLYPVQITLKIIGRIFVNIFSDISGLFKGMESIYAKIDRLIRKLIGHLLLIRFPALNLRDNVKDISDVKNLDKSFSNKSSKKPARSSVLHKLAFFIFGAFFAILFIFVPFQVYAWFRQLPNPQLLAEHATNASTKILDRNGKLLYEIYLDRDYEPVSLNHVPDHVIKATLAIEDNQFYFHHGIRIDSMVRAAKATIFEDNLQGASTITQQLIKNVLLTPERTLSRKVKEAVLSILVEMEYSKDQILEYYLNNIPYGGTAWGIQSGAKKYFGKDVSQLTLAEATMLAGLPAATTIYNPLSDEELAKFRQKQVLAQMVNLEYISQHEADEAYNTPLIYAPQVQYIRAPHFVEYVRAELEKMYGKRATIFGGLTVKTTLDLDLQEKVQNIVKAEVEANRNLNISNGAVVVLDNETREILAYVGSLDYFQEGYGAFDVVTALRQPGSSVKPITYALAFEKGLTPASMVQDTPVSYQTATQVYRPVNYDGRFHGNVSLRSALANSYNIPAVKVVKAVGPDEMVELGNKMGLKNWQVDGTYGLAITLGGKEVKLLDHTNVFATFARQGMYKDTTPFLSIKDIYGYEIFKPDRREEVQVLKPEASYLISNILSDTQARLPAFGTRNFLSIPGHTVAVKTGTTDSKRDNWTMGYTPKYTVGVWVGNNDNSPMNPYLASGLTGAAPIWNKVFTLVLEGKPNNPFIIPENIVVFKDEKCGNRTEVFIKGSNIPKHLCKIEDDKEDKKDEKTD